MSYAGYGQSPQLQQPKVRIEAIGDAWNLLKGQMGTWVFATLIYFAISLGISFAFRLVMGTPTPSPGTPPAAMVASTMAASSGSAIVSTLVGAFFMGGFFRMALKQVRGESISLGDMFSAGDVILPLIGANIAVALLTYVVMLIGFIPGFILLMNKNSIGILFMIVAVVAVIFFSARMIFVIPSVADRRTGVWEAITSSWTATNGQTLNSFLLMLVLGLVIGLSALACGVGMLFTWGLFPLSIALLYSEFFDGERGIAQPSLDMPLPPSTSYYNSRFDMPPPAPGQAPNPTHQQPQAPPPPQGGMPPLNPPTPPGEMPRL